MKPSPTLVALEIFNFSSFPPDEVIDGAIDWKKLWEIHEGIFFVKSKDIVIDEDEKVFIKFQLRRLNFTLVSECEE